MANYHSTNAGHNSLLLNHLGDGKHFNMNKLIIEILLNHLGDGKLTEAIAQIAAVLLNHLGDGKPTKNVRFEFVSGGKRFEMQGSQEDGDTMESILREFEMLKKAM